MCNHLKTRGWKQNVIQSRFDFSASQCVPVCGTTFKVMCVHHHHVLIPAKLGQSLSVVVRMHALILPTSRHGLSLQIQYFSFRMLHVSNRDARSNHLQPSARGPTSTFLPLWHLPALYASLWRGHFTDLPGFANVQFDCNNETCMSICPSSHPIAPLKKVYIQPAHCE